MVKIHDIRYRTKRTNGTRKLSQVTNIARHHSATATGNFDTFWKHWNGTRGWGTGGYHEIILRDGSVELCYGPEEITNGVEKTNTKVYNICMVGNGSFTTEQERVFDIRAKIAMKLFNLPASAVKGHGEFPGANTSCPGINMDSIRKRLTGSVVEQVSNPVIKPKPTPTLQKGAQRGIATVIVPSLSLRMAPTVKGKLIRTLKKGEAYKVWDEQSGWLRLGKDMWASWQDGTYMDWTEKPNVKPKPVSKPTPTPTAKKNTVHLPKSAKTWRTYKLNVQPVKANSDWSLTPSAFGGLTYEIIGRPYANVVTINTGRGKRNIFVGSGTGAVIK